jgi:PAS domain S-box-containing protein
MAGNSDAKIPQPSQAQNTAASAQAGRPTDQELSASKEALRASEAKLQLGVAVAGLGLGAIDYSADTITLDNMAASLFAMPANTPLPRSAVHARFHWDDVAELADQIAKVLDANGSGFMSVDHRIVRPDGSVRWVSARKQVEFAAPETGGPKRATSGLLAVIDITDRKRSEDAVLQNASLFSTLIEQAPTGVYVVDAQFRLQQVNALALPVFKSVQPLIGRDFSEVIETLWGSEVGRQVAGVFRHTLETGEPYVSPSFSEKRADLGIEQSYEWQTQRVTLADGQRGVVCYFQDITERKRTEETLLQSEAKFRATFENAAVGIAHVAPDGAWLDVNQRLCEIVGYSRDEIIAKTFQDITHPDDLEADLECVNNLLKGEANSYMMEKRYLRKDGSIVWANLTVACVRDGEGKIKYFVSVIEDISKRMIAEKAQREVAHRLQNALEAGGLGAWVLDLETKISHSDSRRRSMLGTASTDMSHAEFLSLIHPEDIEKVETALARASDPDSDGQFQFEYRIRRPNDGVERWMNSRGQTIFDNRRPVRITGVSYDFTERKIAEDHLKLLMREVNHRSKNLLTVVQSVARQTARKSDPATFVAHLSERINGLAASQDLLVKNLWKGVDVAALVEAQLSHFKDLIGTRIVVEGAPADLTPSAAQGVGMALHELATNAAKYGALSNNTGRVTIKWQVVSDDSPQFQITWSEEGGPPVQTPNHSGFGQMVIGRMAEAAVSGTAEIQYLESGYFWKLTGPVAGTLEPNLRILPNLKKAEPT